MHFASTMQDHTGIDIPKQSMTHLAEVNALHHAAGSCLHAQLHCVVGRVS